MCEWKMVLITILVVIGLFMYSFIGFFITGFFTKKDNYDIADIILAAFLWPLCFILIGVVLSMQKAVELGRASRKALIEKRSNKNKDKRV